jgi:hypothetical protein
LPALAGAVHQFPQTRHLLAVLTLEARVEEASQGEIDVAGLHQVVGERLHDLARVEWIDLLCSIPPGIAGPESVGGHG